MHRFPNPGSALDNIINCFVFLYENIDRNEIFSLHDMQELLVTNGLVSSSGTMGAEALLRGASKDLSRDKSYNQCKMYAEIYRVLGWIQSGSKALLYNFTILGDHVVHATTNRKKLIENCFIGISYPNEVITVNGEHQIRPFLTILRTMKALDGFLSRDEMIIGPLSMSDDNNPDEFSEMCGRLRELRGAPKEFDKTVKLLLDDRGISKTTAENYTRFPLGALKWLDWAQPERNNTHYSRKQNSYRLTERGNTVLSKFSEYVDVKLDDIKKIPTNLLHELVKHTFFRMLSNSGFDVSDCGSDVNNLHDYEQHQFNAKILLSPFQLLDANLLFDAFNENKPTKRRLSLYSPDAIDDTEIAKSLAHSILLTDKSGNQKSSGLYQKIKSLIPSNTDDEIVESLKQDFVGFNKEQYYPLIGEIFSVLGLNCDIPPHGVNSRRWDAILLSTDDSIPIEIKSPTEEMHISVKAIRQALENKIILQSRKAVPNKLRTTTLAIGFELPNKRAEVNSLINDISEVYGVTIAVLGINSLLKLAIKCVREDKAIEFDQFANQKGIING